MNNKYKIRELLTWKCYEKDRKEINASHQVKILVKFKENRSKNNRCKRSQRIPTTKGL